MLGRQESNWYMRRNKMGRIWGDAIQAGFVDSVIDSNEIYNAWAGLLYLDSYKVIRNLQITNNYLWHDGQPPFLRSGYSPEQCVRDRSFRQRSDNRDQVRWLWNRVWNGSAHAVAHRQ